MASLATLGKRIALNAEKVDGWLTSKQLPTLAFDQDAAEEFPSTAGREDIETARASLIDDTQTLKDLLLGPGEVVRRVCWGSVDNAVQQVLSSFHILEAVPLPGSITYASLSRAVDLPELPLRAVVRQSALNRILAEDPDGSVSHTASSALLLRNQAMRDWYGHCVEELFPSSAKLAEALEKYRGSTDPVDCAFGLAFDTREPIYKFFENEPERQRRFFGAMEGVGKDPGHDLRHVVQGYPWAELGQAKIVDVGGSAGFMSVALAKAHPGLSLVVQDYKHTVEEGQKQLPKDLVGRVDFVPHNFFDPQPTKEADIYIMRHICHNWSDENSAKIISQIVPVMKPNSKILLVEVVVLPSGNEESREAERYMRNVDITMLQMLNTQERSQEQWNAVVKVADPRLQVTGVFKPKGSWDSIIEVSLR
ncbi:hypothetical protein KVT40_001924 [Elsinoe batatas]|uniref:O-methyltransferase C-terminal domain-containing protein n=1 Tax=Elsinoe batatas TaxID=2601811 RepID=A0A8K0L7L9_9PEZI|nr:hypothetical protein KVT40_001924 [Elsinoe batatas]